MNFNLTGAEVIGFVLFCLLVAPVLVLLGKVLDRVDKLETGQQEAAEAREEMRDEIQEISNKVSYMYGRLKNGGK